MAPGVPLSTVDRWYIVQQPLLEIWFNVAGPTARSRGFDASTAARNTMCLTLSALSELRHACRHIMLLFNAARSTWA